MLEVSILSELLDKKLFYRQTETFLLTESDKRATLRSANFLLPGASFIYSTENIWSASEDLHAKQSHAFQFKKKCDGFVLCRTLEHNYIIWIELKSSLNEVFKKAIYQLSGCYVKGKSHLSNFSLYTAEEFEELAIIVCGPEKEEKSDEESTEAVLERRNSFDTESVESIYKRRYRRDGKILLKGYDFGMDQMHLVPRIQLVELPVHVEIQSGEDVVVDLASIIRSVFNHEP